MSEWYVLEADGKTPRLCDVDEWSEWRRGRKENPDASGWKVSYTELPWDGCYVSTVFMGLDHGYGHGPPVLWETLIFNGRLADEGSRYTSYDEALLGHYEWVEKVIKEYTE